jgi:hypothetical protein
MVMVMVIVVRRIDLPELEIPNTSVVPPETPRPGIPFLAINHVLTPMGRSVHQCQSPQTTSSINYSQIGFDDHGYGYIC